MLNKLGPRCARALFNSFRMAAMPAAAVAGLMSLTIPDVIAKTPGSTYCFYGTCHRVKTIAETESLVGRAHSLTASFYDSCKVDRYNPCGLTSSGEEFYPDRADNAASPIYPDGTTLLVWSAETKEAAILRVNNAGPYWGKRNLDVSRAAAEQLGFRHKGVGKLEARIIDAPDRAEATYKRRRQYAPVPGPIGQFDTLDDAMAVAMSFLEVRTVASLVQAPFSLIGTKTTPKPTVNQLLVASKSDKRGGPTAAKELVAAAAAKETTAKEPPLPRVATAESSVKPVAVAERRARKAERRVASRASSRKSAATRLAAAKRMPVRVASVARDTQPRHHGPLITLDYGSHAQSVASGRTARIAAPQRSAKMAGMPGRTASLNRGRNAKRLSMSPARLRVSDARDVMVMPTRAPVTGSRSLPPASLIRNEQSPRLRGVPARQLLAVA